MKDYYRVHAKQVVYETQSTRNNYKVVAAPIYTDYDRLDGVVSGKGNHVNPVYHAYTKTSSGQSGSIQRTWTATDEKGSFSCCDNVHGSFGRSAPSLALPSRYTEAYNEALSDIFDQIRGSTDLSIDAFQGKQTLAQLKTFTPAKLIGRLTNLSGLTKKVVKSAKLKRHELNDTFGSRAVRRAYSNNRWDTAMDVASAISQEWLGWVYGIKPVLQDIYDVSAAIHEGAHKVPVAYFEARKSRITSDTYVIVSTSTEQYVASRERSDRCEIKLGIAHPKPDSLEITKFASLNPASWAWEMIPWSFVIDHFINIGSYLRNAETAIAFGADFRGGYVTKTSRVRNTGRYSRSYSAASPPNYREYGFGSAWYTQTVKERAPLSGIPFPSAPQFSPQLGSGFLLNAAALLGSFLGKS